jgi:hypothetical protein
MFYRDFMQKYRPLYAPDAPGTGGAVADGAAAAASGGPIADAGAGGSSAASAQDTAPAAAAPAALDAGAAPVPDGAAAKAEVSSGEPSLLEAASSKPTADTNKDSPAPADAAMTDGDKPTAKDVKPEAGDKSKPTDDKDAANADPDKKDASAKEPPAPIKYDAFKLPDGVKLDDERLGKFTEIAGQAQVPQDVAQSLVDLHIAEMQRYAEEVTRQTDQHQRDVWNTLNDTWKAEARKDSQIGGNRLETALARGKAVLEEYGGTPEQVRELIAHTTNNGMGNFPGFLRLLDNIAGALNIFEDSSVGGNTAPPKVATSRAERWYGNSNMNGGAKAP